NWLFRNGPYPASCSSAYTDRSCDLPLKMVEMVHSEARPYSRMPHRFFHSLTKVSQELYPCHFLLSYSLESLLGYRYNPTSTDIQSHNVVIDCRPNVLRIYDINEAVSKKLVYENTRFLLKRIVRKNFEIFEPSHEALITLDLNAAII